MRSVMILILLLGCSAGAADFTAEEIRTHKERIELITDTASRCLDATFDDHIAFYNRWKVSKYYGDRRPDYATLAGRKAQLRAYGYNAAQVEEISRQQTSTSCIGMTMSCLKKGFAAAGQSAVWDKIYAHLKIDNKFYGTDLQKDLQKLGWRILYWNPDPSQNAAWDAEDQRLSPLKPGQKWNPKWGGHSIRYNSVMKNGTYYGTRVDDASTLVGFQTSPPVSFKSINFFVGIAHSGYHVFPGRGGEVIEAHSSREMNSRDNMEYSQFNPINNGGGPRWSRTERYRSGLIAVPPSR